MTPHASEDPRLSDGVRRRWYAGMGFQILVALVLGIVVGFAFPRFGASLKILGDVFLALIKAGVAPLVFLTVVSGVASAGDVRSAGRVGWRAIVYFEVVSSIALGLGLLYANLVGAGKGVAIQAATGLGAPATPKSTMPTFNEFIGHIVPDNFLGAFVKGELLQVVVLALLVGIGILTFKVDQRAVVTKGIDTISSVLFAFINVIMKLAPLGTFGAVAYSVGSNGSAVLIALAQLIVTYWILVILFICVVLGGICALAGFNIFRFLRYLKDEIVLTLGTASSEPALPRLLVKLEDLGVSKQTVGLVLPTGYTFNLDGTSLYTPMCVVFLANAYGVPLSFEQELGILVIMLLTSKGAATVNGGTFVVFAATVTASGILPPEGLPLIFGVYRFMSMATATLNVLGNAVATMVVGRWAKELDMPTLRRELGARP
jgi:aerobic C4-dicarboxylate transport protein